MQSQSIATHTMDIDESIACIYGGWKGAGTLTNFKLWRGVGWLPLWQVLPYTYGAGAHEGTGYWGAAAV